MCDSCHSQSWTTIFSSRLGPTSLDLQDRLSSLLRMQSSRTIRLNWRPRSVCPALCGPPFCICICMPAGCLPIAQPRAEPYSVLRQAGLRSRTSMPRGTFTLSSEALVLRHGSIASHSGCLEWESFRRLYANTHSICSLIAASRPLNHRNKAIDWWIGSGNTRAKDPTTAIWTPLVLRSSACPCRVTRSRRTRMCTVRVCRWLI